MAMNLKGKLTSFTFDPQSCYHRTQGEQLPLAARGQGALQPDTPRCGGQYPEIAGARQGCFSARARGQATWTAFGI